VSHAATKWAFDQPEQHRDMKPSEWAVLMVLADCHNPVNGCFPSQDYICSKTNLGERAVRDQLARLRERGLINWDAAREGGRRGSNRYRLGFEPDFQPAKSAGSSDEAPTGENAPDQPADSDSSNRQNLPPNPVREPVKEPEREGAGARAEESQPEAQAPEDTPGRADFERRVLRFCNGRGYIAGPWPDWDTGAAPGWIAAQFARLTPEERGEAERWRDAYLLDVADRKKTPVAPGNFLKSRMWTALEPVLLERLEKARQAKLAPEERAKPDGWAAMLGPVGMARLFAYLLEGQPGGHPTPGAHWFEAELRRDWPAVHQWKEVLLRKGGIIFAERWHALKDRLEPVPQGTDILAAWKAEFSARGWPWLSAFDGAQVVYCPKGGPAGLTEFEAALRQGNEEAGQHEHGGGREAAE
jgi:hypothetical protein